MFRKSLLGASLMPIAIATLGSTSLHAQETSAPMQTQAASADQASKRVAELADEFWAIYRGQNPVVANYFGDFTELEETGNPLNASTVYASRLDALIAEVAKLETAGLSDEDRVTVQMLEWTANSEKMLATNPSRYLAFNTFIGPVRAMRLVLPAQPINTPDQYKSYTQRVRNIGPFVDNLIALMEEGIKEGWSQPCDTIVGIDKAVMGMRSADGRSSFAFRPVTRISGLDDSAITAMEQDLANAIDEVVNPAFERYAAFLSGEYQESCRNTYGLSAMPGGAQAYEALLDYNASDPSVSAQSLHDLGLSEVARLRKEMIKVKGEAGFEGSLEEFFEHLRTSPEFEPKSGDDYLKSAALIAKRIDAALPRFFGNIPRNPFTITPVPEESAPYTALGYYGGGSLEGGRAGTYYLNLYDLPSRSMPMLPALTLHEASPGHHFQTSIALETKGRPMFRRSYFISAYGEGWAMYTEFLGEEMGIYQNPYESFERLTLDMWRACRLVIDTGIHTKGWSKQKAVDYLLANTSLTELNVNNEVNRYITMPGQAVSYKYGQLKMLKLRAKAEEALGADFDIRTFHDELLRHGALSLDVLETEIDRWIASELAKKNER